MPMIITMPVSMSMSVVVRAYILHLIHGAADGAPLARALAVHAQPEGVVGVGGAAGAAGELLEAEGVYGDGVC